MIDHIDPKKVTDFSNEPPTLFYRKVDGPKMDAACSRTIDFLRQELKLEPHECFFVVQTLYKEFPKECLVKQ
jgi:hypothetical protein